MGRSNTPANLAGMPMHMQVLHALKREAEARKRKHEQLCGKGLEDREYQRHVGRIAEVGAQIEAIERLLHGGIDELDDELEEQNETASNSGKARTRSHRRA